MNGTVALFTISFIHGDFFYFYFRDVALENSLSFGDNDIVVRYDLPEACDALFW